MGGELPHNAQDGPPLFAVSALRDPGGNGSPSHPLERIQIIKGWVEDGKAKEKVYEVAGTTSNENELDLNTCQSTAPGNDQLCEVWKDPDFDPENPAFYYARVLEVPSCRWNRFVCNAQKVDCSDPESVPGQPECLLRPEDPRHNQGSEPGLRPSGTHPRRMPEVPISHPKNPRAKLKNELRTQRRFTANAYASLFVSLHYVPTRGNRLRHGLVFTKAVADQAPSSHCIMVPP